MSSYRGVNCIWHPLAPTLSAKLYLEDGQGNVLLLVGGSVCEFAGCACSCVGAGGKRRWWRWVAEGCNKHYKWLFVGQYVDILYVSIPHTPSSYCHEKCIVPPSLSVMEYKLGIAPHSISHFLPFALLLTAQLQREDEVLGAFRRIALDWRRGERTGGIFSLPYRGGAKSTIRSGIRSPCLCARC